MSKASYRQDNAHFIFTNENPSNILSAGDCVIRAIAYALKQSWETTFMDMCNLGYKMNRMPNDDKVIEIYLKTKGWKKHRQARKDDNTKFTAAEFARMSGESKVVAVIRVANHLSVVDNGFIRDTWDCGDKTVGGFWTKE